MPLRAIDAADLDELGLECSTFDENGATFVELRRFGLPSAYLPREVTLLIRLPAGYPNAAPDMYWTLERVRLANGAEPIGATMTETYGGRQWQRWSRHLDPTMWRPAIDSLRAYVMIVRRDLAKGR